jgi:argonaute-like protein implicated in RNA metabolism and viral defense
MGNRKERKLIDNTRKYLSTLPHLIEVLEELIVAIAVTSNLLTSKAPASQKFEDKLKMQVQLAYNGRI